MTDIQQILDALASRVRREILWLIWDDEQASGAIARAVGLSPPTVSEHLGVLRDAGLVTMHASGTFRRYRACRDRLRALQSLVVDEGSRWIPADDLPERAGARAQIGSVVTARTDVDVDVETAFRAFVEPRLYSAWLGVPVSIEDGRFSTTLEFGTTVRGNYDVVVPGSLIALRWDFADDGVPTPGAAMTGYMRFRPGDAPSTCAVEVHQLVDSEQQAQFMEAAWTMVLGRLHAHLLDALANEPIEREPRPKLRSAARRSPSPG